MCQKKLTMKNLKKLAAHIPVLSKIIAAKMEKEKKEKEENIKKAKQIANKFADSTPVQSKMITLEIEKKKKEDDIEKAKQIASNLDDRTPVHSQMIAAEMKK